MVIGIVCEFDPLHRGHARLLSHARALGADTVVCAMSGSFTQRGSFAALSKTARAEMAVRCGADLVLELPTPWAMSPAETFARGGVRLLALAGADTLLFGSECGDLPALRCLADCLDSPTFADHLTAAPESGLTFAARRQAAAASLLDNATAALLQSPNNTLAVEYLRALRHTRSAMTPCTLRREGAGHDGAPEGDTASASFLRELLRQGRGEAACAYMPTPAADVLRRELAAGRIADGALCERAILVRLRAMTEADWRPYDPGNEGLYHRLYQGIPRRLHRGGDALRCKNQALSTCPPAPHGPQRLPAITACAGACALPSRVGCHGRGPRSSALSAGCRCPGADEACRRSGAGAGGGGAVHSGVPLYRPVCAGPPGSDPGRPRPGLPYHTGS